MHECSSRDSIRISRYLATLKPQLPKHWTALAKSKDWRSANGDFWIVGVELLVINDVIESTSVVVGDRGYVYDVSLCPIRVSSKNLFGAHSENFCCIHSVSKIGRLLNKFRFIIEATHTPARRHHGQGRCDLA